MNPLLLLLLGLAVDRSSSFVHTTATVPIVMTSPLVEEKRRRIPGWYHRVKRQVSPSTQRFSTVDIDTSKAEDGSRPKTTTKKKKASSATQLSSSPSTFSSLPKRIITCATTDELREAVETYIESHHVVAEIGSQLREVSSVICTQSQRAVLVDIQRKVPHTRTNQQDSRRTNTMRGGSGGGGTSGTTADSPSHAEPSSLLSLFPSNKVSFHEMEQLSDWSWTIFPNPSIIPPPSSDGDGTSNGRCPTNAPFDVLVLDVNAMVGNDLEWTSLQIIQQFHALNRCHPELIVLVKSSGLNQWANRIHPATYWRHHQDDLWAISGTNSGGSSSNPPPCMVIATVGVEEYRSTIDDTVRPTDFVLEVGCHYGTTTSILHTKAAHCMGVDVGRKIIEHAKNRFPGIDFRVGDAWKTGELLRFLQDYDYNSGKGEELSSLAVTTTASTTPITIMRKTGFDVIYVDVGGLSGNDGLLEAIQLISSLRYTLEPRCIVIKSKCMQRLSTRLMSYWMLKRNQRRRSKDDMS